MEVANYADLIGSAKPSGSGTVFVKGAYPALYLDKLVCKTSEKSKDALVIPEFDILESAVPERPAGTQVSEVFNLTGAAKQVHPGKLRALIGALLGVEEDELDALKPEQVTVIETVLGKDIRYVGGPNAGKPWEKKKLDGAIVGKALSPDQPLHGRLVRAECHPRAGKINEKTGEEWTNVKYSPLPEEHQALANDARAAAGFPPI